MDESPKVSLQFTAAGILVAGLVLVVQKIWPGLSGETSRSLLIILSGIAFLFSQLKNKPQYIFFATGFLGLMAAYSTYSFVHVYFHLFQDPQEWDFLCYFMDGKMAVHGLNFYLPENAQVVVDQMSLPYTPSEGFKREIIDSGFGLNPPPSMFMFLPLGYFSYGQAQLIWTSFISLCLVGSIALSVPIFFTEKRTRIVGILFFIILALCWAPSRKTLFLGQTNFIALLMLMLFWWKAKSPVSGAFAALAMFVKPVLLILPGLLLVQRKWKHFGFAVGTSIVLSLLTILVFGWETFSSFFIRLPDTQVSHMVLTEIENQSLTAGVMRLSGSSSLGSFVVPILSILILGSSAYVTHKIREKEIGWAIAVSVTGFLMVYPGTLFHYGVLLLPVIVFFLCEWKKLTHRMVIFGYLTALLAIVILAGTFWANLIAWLLSLGICSYKIINLPK